ncbi:MAG TPA: inositol monophosphatase family protein [Abditibacteriaceae bacterium]|nr:inositol monophosphatase family protein [Abditibacteriaceae bacterium]
MLPFEPDVALDIVREAAHMALDLRGRCAVEIKPDNTFVTAADRQLEAFLHERLGALAPEYSFLGEETGLTGAADAPCWVIDPIDGTNNFVRDIPLWCISVGLVAEGRSIFGIIAVPSQDEMYWATQGEGAWREKCGQKTALHVIDNATLMHEDLIACNTDVERVVDFSDMRGCLRNFGSVAYHLACVARGSATATMARMHKLYDIAGGMCICIEAGCATRYLDEREWVADVTAAKELTPLLVAPPRTLDVLLNTLKIRDPKD